MTNAPEISLRLKHGGTVVLGPGRAELMALIAETGSIAAAGRRMRMSYKRAWALAESLNTQFSAPLVEAAKGGAGGGGARLTALGAEMLAAYRALEDATRTAGAAHLARIEAALSK